MSKKIVFSTTSKKLLADLCTPVGIYLRIRDKFRDSFLLESADFNASNKAYSFICVNAVAGIELVNTQVEWKYPNQEAKKLNLPNGKECMEQLTSFFQAFQPTQGSTEEAFAQGFYGYTAYDAITMFEPNVPVRPQEDGLQIPQLRYRMFQYVIAIHHFKNEMYLLENHFTGIPSQMDYVEQLITSTDVPSYPFALQGTETSNCSNDEYLTMVKEGIKNCQLGNVFQIVVSRRFQQRFKGDDFNVYRSLRNVNPSPYLFYFDYGNYRIMGSSPESQLIVQNNVAIMHPIAGTVKRTGDDAVDTEAASLLLANAKENAEHTMLVDLARNDLSRVGTQTRVTKLKEIQTFSHVIHMVSEVQTNLLPTHAYWSAMKATFPAGTLSGAPKVKAMQLITELEPTARGTYGGAIGFWGCNGSCNHAILIRSFFSKNNTLYYQAGAGVVVNSSPQSELEEVNNKLAALKKAIENAEKIS